LVAAGEAGGSAIIINFAVLHVEDEFEVTSREAVRVLFVEGFDWFGNSTIDKGPQWSEFRPFWVFTFNDFLEYGTVFVSIECSHNPIVEWLRFVGGTGLSCFVRSIEAVAANVHAEIRSGCVKG